MTTRAPRKKKAAEPAAQVEAEDVRPFIVGTKVILRGEIRDGPHGEVVAVKEGEVRSVKFAGDSKPCDVTLDMLRRLP